MKRGWAGSWFKSGMFIKSKSYLMDRPKIVDGNPRWPVLLQFAK